MTETSRRRQKRELEKTEGMVERRQPGTPTSPLAVKELTSRAAGLNKSLQRSGEFLSCLQPGAGLINASPRGAPSKLEEAYIGRKTQYFHFKTGQMLRIQKCHWQRGGEGGKETGEIPSYLVCLFRGVSGRLDSPCVRPPAPHEISDPPSPAFAVCRAFHPDCPRFSNRPRHPRRH